jgi:hypothetical protein
MMTRRKLIEGWLHAKKEERDAVERRRTMEDQLFIMSRFTPGVEGTQQSDELDGYIVRVVARIDRKVDVDKVTEIAAEHDLTALLPQLFRWKAEINKSVWGNTDPELIAPLLDAITPKGARPSFTVITVNH